MATTPEPGPQDLFAIPPQARSRTSDVFGELADRARQGNVSLRILTERLGDRTFGVLLVMLAAFNVIPLVSLFSGLLIASLGLQMALGIRQAKLPNRILDWPLPAERVADTLVVFEQKIRLLERYIRPRWQFSEAPVVDRMNGLLIALLGLITALPLPLTNLGPALVVVVMGLGLLERDGLVQCLAFGIGVLAIVLIVTLL